MIRFAVVSYCVLYVVVSSLRQLAHGPPHTTAAKNRAGSPHSMYMYLLLVQHTILVNSLHAMLARTSLARKRSRASLEKKLPPPTFNLLFGKRATLGRSCCCCCYCCCGRRRRSSTQALRADVRVGVNWKGASDCQTICFFPLWGHTPKFCLIRQQ